MRNHGAPGYPALDVATAYDNARLLTMCHNLDDPRCLRDTATVRTTAQMGEMTPLQFSVCAQDETAPGTWAQGRGYVYASED